jgi:deazaflavin-dependent oxidoreductase (nitroreductase family)
MRIGPRGHRVQKRNETRVIVKIEPMKVSLDTIFSTTDQPKITGNMVIERAKLMLRTAAAHSWEWTPSPFSNAVVSTMLRIPFLHRLMSSQILLLTFTGRKSGKRYTTPVGYVREGKTVTILTKWFRPWWRNFQETAPVEVLIEGKVYPGTAKALTDEATIIPIITDVIEKYPYYADIYGVRLVSPNQPDMDDVRHIAPKVIVLQIALTG